MCSRNIEGVPNTVDWSCLQKHAGNRCDGYGSCHRCNDDYKPSEPSVDSKETDEQDGNGRPGQDGDHQARRIRNPHPFQYVDLLLRGCVASVMFTKSIGKRDGHTGLRREVKDLLSHQIDISIIRFIVTAQQRRKRRS